MTDPANQTDAVGIDLSKVDTKLVNAALTEAGINPGRRATTEERVRLLEAYELAQCPGDGDLPEPEKKLGDCTVCNGVSQFIRPACPYCGTAEEQPSATVVPVASQPAKSAKGKTAVAPTPGKSIFIPKDAGTVLAANVAKLDEAASSIRSLVREGDGVAYRLGKELKRVKEEGLHKFRVDDAGKPAYGTFERCCLLEFGMTPQHANNFVRNFEQFTEKELLEVGSTKLTVIASVEDKAKRTRLLKAAPDLTVSELKSKVRAATPKPPSDGVSRITPEGKPKPARALREGEVTAVMALKTHDLSFERNGEAFVARVALENATVATVSITLDGDGLTGSLSFEREPEVTE